MSQDLQRGTSPLLEHVNNSLVAATNDDFTIPKALKDEYSKYTPMQLEDATKDFIQRVETQYYLEWFWFPYQNEVWTNTWSSRLLSLSSGMTCH